MKTMHTWTQKTLLALLVLGLALSGCASMSKTGKGAAIGSGAGAIIGGIIGKASGDTAKGAVVGATVGGVAGAIIGKQMDEQAEELGDELEGAEIERVGEGIQITFDSAILFDVDSATLQSESQTNLSNLATSLNKYENTEVKIVGHTDDTGSDEYNQKLSERRANSVADFLMAQGVNGTRLTTIGLGETTPIADNESTEGRQQNRRVELAIFASEAYREQLKEEHGENQ